MKLFVNGNERELDPVDATVGLLGDRLVVKTAAGSNTAAAVRDGDAVLISYLGNQYKVEYRRPTVPVPAVASNGEIRAPMPGQIVDLLVASGSQVRKGEGILVLEAMKTQQAFTAPFDGKVTKIAVSKGDQVIEGALLAHIESLAQTQ